MPLVSSGDAVTHITDTLNSGIARTVAWLRANGFDTTDSGDGEMHQHDCDRGYPYVSMRGTEADARRLAALLRSIGIALPPSSEVWSIGHDAPQGVSVSYSYDPADDVGIVDLAGLCDAALPADAPTAATRPATLALPVTITALGAPVTVRYAEPGELPEGVRGSWTPDPSGESGTVLLRPGMHPVGEAIILVHELLHLVDEAMVATGAAPELVPHEWVEGAAFRLASLMIHLGVIRGVTVDDWRAFMAQETNQ